MIFTWNFRFPRMLISYSIDYNDRDKTMITGERSKIRTFSVQPIYSALLIHPSFIVRSIILNRVIIDSSTLDCDFFFLHFFSLVNSESSEKLIFLARFFGSYLYDFSLVMFGCFVDQLSKSYRI